MSGDTGLIGGPLQCAFTYGGPRDESFSAVDRAAHRAADRQPGDGRPLDLARVSARTSTWSRPSATPCNVLAQATIGNSTTAAFGEAAADVKEVLVAVDPLLGVPVGSLALTGYRGTTLGTNRDAFLLFAKNTNLFGITGTLFGDHATRNDAGASLAQNVPGGLNPPGFILAGMSESDFAAIGDPRDLYQVQADNSAKTSCSISWVPPSNPQTWVSTSPATVTGAVVTPIAIPTDFLSLNTNFINCP